MGSDNEICEDEDEILVYVEFEGLVDGNVFSEEQLQLDMIGIDTEHPIMKINGKFYEGTYEDVGGTYMFFAKNDTLVANDPVFDEIPSLKYFAKTRKILKMQRIFIKPRTEVLGDSDHYQCIPNLNTLQIAGVPCRYQEEALSFWKSERTDRLNALHSYLEKRRIRQEKKDLGITLESDSDEDNPFAMYSHKDDSNIVNKVEDTCDQDEETSSHCGDEFHSKPMFPNEIINETLNTIESSCDSNIQEFETSAVKSQSSILADDNCHLNTHKTRLLKKKNVSKARTIQKVKDKKARPLSKGRKPFNKIEEASETATSSTIENKNIEDKFKQIIVETCNTEVNRQESDIDKISKQLKREAKMKEISEQLKAYAREYKC
nr:general transcription factor 3C polypeptide 6 [Megalopta genalis]